MPIAFDRSLCCDINEAISREWLITNGLGGYASGTVAGTLTRIQHGLLVASSRDEASPRLLLAKIDEEILFDQRTYYLGTNEYRDGTMNPAGFVHLETFRLEEGLPIFTYRIGGIDGILLEKRIWMASERNTTYIQYRAHRPQTPEGSIHKNNFSNGIDKNGRLHNGRSHQQEHTAGDQRVLTLTLLPFAAYRLYNECQYGNNEWQFQVKTHQAEEFSLGAEEQQHSYADDQIAGCTIRARDDSQPYHIFVVGNSGSETTFLPTGVWYWHFLRRVDRTAGLDAVDDLYLPGVFRAKLWPDKASTVTIIVTAEELSTQTFNTGQLNLTYKKAFEEQHAHGQPRLSSGERRKTFHTFPVLPINGDSHPSKTDEEFIQYLWQAGNRFFAKRSIPSTDLSGNHLPSSFFNDNETIPILIPGYFDMQDNIREMLIAIPGLILTTGKYATAQHILRYLARYFKQGMLPDRLPTPARPLQEGDYKSIDTSLWYFYALDHYLQITRDYELLYDVYQHLVDAVAWYMQGTYHDIHVNPQDGLLEAHHPGAALTWMNARVHNTPVTPRYGKPVEVNALWYHALSLMDEWSQLLCQKGRINDPTTLYKEQSSMCKQSFNERFWYAEGNYLYDVVDGPNGDDLSLRPNQLLAISLRYPVLHEDYRKRVLDLIARELLTPFGLRTLAPNDIHYHSQLQENFEEQQRALHQGSVWTWLLGPYIDALLCVEKPATPPQSPQEHNIHLEQLWRTGLHLLEPFQLHLTEGVLGMFGGVFDGNAPHASRYIAASAISTGEILRIYDLLAHLYVRFQNKALII
ncbi:MAG: amylo-alpha-1,6-glucosidase [Ktedonobacteraceae bacterium]